MTTAKKTADKDTAKPAENNKAEAAKAPAKEKKTEAPAIFDKAVGFVLAERIEGGYVNDPRDPGGETNFGISKRAYKKLNIKALTRDDAIAIYRRDYWDAAECDTLPAPVAVAVFDAAVNQGVGTAKRLLQKALRVNSDGIIGPVTRSAIDDADPYQLTTEFLSWRLRRYAFTVNAATYMRGWSNRILHLQAFLIEDLEAA